MLQYRGGLQTSTDSRKNPRLCELVRMHPRVGARQVGKTTLINRLFGDTHQTFVFDPVQDLYGERADPQLFLRNSPAPLILDEIQYGVRIFDDQTRENLAEYMARPPLSLKIIRHEPFKSRVLFHTTYSEYFQQNVKMFDALDFIRWARLPAKVYEGYAPRLTHLFARMRIRYLDHRRYPGSRTVGWTNISRTTSTQLCLRGTWAS